MHIVIHEDRADCLTGVKLLLLSLARHCPGLAITCSTSGDGIPAEWAARFPSVSFRSFPDLCGMSWNIKPKLLLKLLDEGHEELLWIDSDIIVTRDFRPIFQSLDPGTVVGAQEVYWGQAQGTDCRTLAWGLPVGRILPTTFNSGVVRVTPRHRLLLQAWSELLSHPTYVESQRRPWQQRPVHMIGDQEVLTALVGSSYFADVPVLLLKRGSQIAQLFGPAGYTIGERLANLGRDLPPFVHAMGRKPWIAAHPQGGGARAFYERVAAELSLYTWVARQYANELGGDTSWMWAKTPPGRLMALLSFGSPHLRGLPLAVLDSAVRTLRKSLGIARLSLQPAHAPVHLTCLAGHDRPGYPVQAA